MKKLKSSVVKKTAVLGTALSVALGSGIVGPVSAPTVMAHGGTEDFVPLRTTLEEFGATISGIALQELFRSRRTARL
jgi:primary-amine oxidase